MANNRVSKTRRQPAREAKAKKICYVELNSDDIEPVTPRPLTPPPFRGPSPEPPVLEDSSPVAAHDSPTPTPAQDNTTPTPAQDNATPEAAAQEGEPPAADQNNEKSATPEESSMDASSELGTPPPGEFDHPNNFPPQFWDGLSRTYLTKRSLREFDRRNEALPHPKLERPAKRPKSIAHWAMHGGPDTRHLRGFQGPQVRNLAKPRTKVIKRRHLRADPLSAYDLNLGQWLHDNSIYLVGSGPTEEPEFPSNIDAIIGRLHQPYPALKPKNFTEAHFKRWKAQNAKAKPNDLMANVFRTILDGKSGSLRARNVQLTNLAPLAGEAAPVVPGPTAFDASPVDSLNGVARCAQEDKLVPVVPGDLVAPNFFLEASGVEGALIKDVEERRACYHGALGSRAMHVMQNICREDGDVVYDGQARAFSATYVRSEGLSLHAHHVLAPKEEGGRPRYHMTNLGVWDLRKSRKRWADGVGAFRNLLELAAEVRGDSIELANYVVEDPPVENSE